MSEQKSASETAETTALVRAVACFEPDGRIRVQDCLARMFLQSEKRDKLDKEQYRSAVKTAARNGLYEYIIARTTYFDGLFANAIKDGIPQIVILGAGYDSRAYRFGSGTTKIFEVDATFTQERKISILKANGIDCGKVSFVPVDFEKDDMFLRLEERGHDLAQLTYFLWEGVSFYLTPDAVRATLMAIKQNCRGSVVVFDYLNTSLSGEHEIIRKDERVLFGMEKSEIETWLSSLGFRVLENLNPSEITARFLTGTDGKVFGNTKDTMNFMKAAV